MLNLCAHAKKLHTPAKIAQTLFSISWIDTLQNRTYTVLLHGMSFLEPLACAKNDLCNFGGILW